MTWLSFVTAKLCSLFGATVKQGRARNSVFIGINLAMPSCTETEGGGGAGRLLFDSIHHGRKEGEGGIVNTVGVKRWRYKCIVGTTVSVAREGLGNRVSGRQEENRVWYKDAELQDVTGCGSARIT